MNSPDTVTPVLEKEETYILKLYIAGGEQNSRLARENLKSICEKYLKDRCQVEEIDVLEDFASALKDKIFVTPSLILERPEPRVTIIGTLANSPMVVSSLRIRI